MERYFMSKAVTQKLHVTFQQVKQIKKRQLLSIIVLLSSMLLTSCSGDNTEISDPAGNAGDSGSIAGAGNVGDNGSGSGDDSGSNATTDNSFIIGALVKIEDAVNYQDTDIVALLDKVRGSVGKISSGSKVIWSRKNDAGLGLYISANHVIGIDSWPTYDEGYIDISINRAGGFNNSHLVNASGDFDLLNELIADFPLYHPSIPTNIINTTILPENDFYLGVIDNQRMINDGLDFIFYPDTIQTNTPLTMYDPQNRTLSEQTWAEAVDGEQIMVVGYPQDAVNYPNGAVSIGHVFTDNDALEMIDLLFQHGDEEGSIPYNAEVEFLVDARAIGGMSGGGVFNAEGQLLGVLVRGTEINDQAIVRVVRVGYIKATFERFYHTLFQDEQDYLKQFIGLELE
jgi:hypothetical protein